MYHTFSASSSSTGVGEGSEEKSARPPASRRISTSNACVECRRRKIRCDGLQPCGQCQWYQHPEICFYAKPAQRVVPSRKLVERLQAQADQYSSVLSRLFPGKDVETVLPLSREELINLALTLPARSTSPSVPSDRLAAVPESIPQSDSAESLEALEQAPEQDPVSDEAKRHKDKVQGISDDVNGLSLSVDRQSSYVGASSITAAFKVIFKTAPVARPFILRSYVETALPSRSNTPPRPQSSDPNFLPPPEVGRRLIESYFTHVHVMMPMVDEDNFWHTYLYAERRDSPWLALLNIVLALGSLSGSTCDDEEHIAYFQRSRTHLDLETFGSGSLLVLQALGLIGGYYLHWLNRPNEANSLMGAALRMATALGLHREYSTGSSTSASAQSTRGPEIPVEIRRRTWWSLFCLDTWAFMTTGRPSLGRLSPAVTVQSPRIPEQTSNAQYQSSLRLLFIIHNIDFCKLATRIQDKLAIHPLLKPDELFSLDAELVRWHDELPPILQAIGEPSNTRPRHNSTASGKAKAGTPSAASASLRDPFDFSQPPERDHTVCPDVLKTPRAVMHWWYMTLRMLMHRPYLLAATLRRTPFANLSAEEKVAVSKCRVIASDAIRDIEATCRPELIAGWNAVWLMYQATMVPLVSLFSYLSSPAAYVRPGSPGKPMADVTIGSDEVDRWRAQIESAIGFFDSMQRYSVAAKKSRDVVQRLYDASKHVRQYHEAFYLQQQLLQTQRRSQNATQVFSDIAANTVIADAPAVNEHAPLSVSTNNLKNIVGHSAWGTTPSAETATSSSFWDDMMWDTFSVPNVNQIDWYTMNGMQGEPNVNDNAWTDWNFNGQLHQG